MRPLLALLLGGCTPILPFHLAETAETLNRGGVSLTVAGGGGGGRDLNGCCGGGAVRASFGVGHRMEVGLETAVVGGAPINHQVSVLTKLRYKVGLGKYLALVAGFGGVAVVDTNGSSADGGLGADLALLWSTGPLARRLRLYGGARFSFVFALQRDFYGGGGPSQALVIPVGLSVAATRGLRLFVEGGLIGGWSENHTGRFNQYAVYNWIGGYGALAIAYSWNP